MSTTSIDFTKIPIDPTKIEKYALHAKPKFKNKIEWIVYSIFNGIKHIAHQSDWDKEMKRIITIIRQDPENSKKKNKEIKREVESLLVNKLKEIEKSFKESLDTKKIPTPPVEKQNDANRQTLRDAEGNELPDPDAYSPMPHKEIPVDVKSPPRITISEEGTPIPFEEKEPAVNSSEKPLPLPTGVELPSKLIPTGPYRPGKSRTPPLKKETSARAEIHTAPPSPGIEFKTLELQYKESPSPIRAYNIAQKCKKLPQETLNAEEKELKVVMYLKLSAASGYDQAFSELASMNQNNAIEDFSLTKDAFVAAVEKQVKESELELDTARKQSGSKREASILFNIGRKYANLYEIVESDAYLKLAKDYLSKCTSPSAQQLLSDITSKGNAREFNRRTMK